MPIETLVTIPFSEVLLNRLQGVSPKLNITSLLAARAEDVSAELWERTEILYTGTILPDPDQAPSLRWIQFHFAGIDRSVPDFLLGCIDRPRLQPPGMCGDGSCCRRIGSAAGR